MGWELLNVPMMWGLAGLSLPLLAHLLSRKKYEVVPWAAMQFLELEKDVRRRFRLEEFLLLLLRMALVALLVIALSRPASSGGWLAGLLNKTRRDVVIVVDGSYSMGWRGGHATPHATAIQWAHRYLEDLGPGDQVAVIDARDQVRDIITPPTVNHDRVRSALNHLPPPAGTTHLAEAIRRAVELLRDTKNLRREIVVLTDGQAVGWHADDTLLWERLDDQLESFPETTRPRLWVVTPTEVPETRTAHFRVDHLETSRELAPAGLPITVRTTVHGHGNRQPVDRRVWLEINGQRLADRSLSVRVPPSGKTTVEFEHRFRTTGSHRVAVILDEDQLPGDDRAESVIVAVAALPILLVDGDPQPDLTRSEAFFARAALSARSNQQPWIDVRVVGWDRLEPADLVGPEVIVLANVPRIGAARLGPIVDFVTAGGGLLITLGDRIEHDAWNKLAAESGLLPVRLIESQQETGNADEDAIRVADASLTRSWLDRFRSDSGGGFVEARFARWWSVEPTAGDEPAHVAARLTNGHPLLVTGRLGRGQIAAWTSSLDADWNTLPARPDYVSFLHELLFRLSGGRSARNVDVGEPLLLAVGPDFKFSEHAFYGPGDTRFDVAQIGDRTRPVAQLGDTRLPGRYTLRSRQPAAGQERRTEHFVVNSDRRESELEPLAPDIRQELAEEDRLSFITSLSELHETARRDAPRTELWHMVLFLFLGLLISEVVLTRRMVRGGYQQEPSSP